MKATNFNVVAPFYDLLARFVFGNTIQGAQTHFLNELENCHSILVLGGGTGSALKDFVANAKGKITYVDSSDKMITLAKKNLSSSPDQIQFICGTEVDIPAVFYDAVILNFFLDMFSENELDRVMNRVKISLSSNSLILVTDFRKNKAGWQRVLLTSMYLFFRLTCNIKAKRLPDWNLKLQNAGFNQIKSTRFFNGFIETCLYRSE